MSINRIKAIETFYKGYHFRSRLEARWAVFFETLGWSWEYEPEGFQTTAGNYLPDFYIKDIDHYIEIKPMPDDPDNYNPDDRFIDLAKEKNMILIAGNPWPGNHYCYYFFGIVDDDYILQLANEFTECGKCDTVVLLHGDYGVKYLEKDKCNYGKWPVSHIGDKKLEGRVGEAYMAARSARFED